MLAAPMLRRNLALDAIAALGWGAGVGVVNGLLPGLARLGGADPIGLAALGAAPFVANVSALFAGYLGAEQPRRVAITRALGCSMLLFAPLVPAQWLIFLVVGFWMGGALTTPVQHHIWGLIYPPRSRAQLVSYVRTVQSAAAAVAALGGGFVADRLGGTPVVLAAGLLSATCGAAYGGISAPSHEGNGRFSASDSVRAVFGNPVMRWIVIAQITWGVGLFAAQPLYALVQVDRLHLSLTEIGSLAIVTSAATVASFFAWGAVCDRRNGIAVMAAGCVLGLLAPAIYALAPDIRLLWLASVCAGFANSAIDIGYTSVLGERVPLALRATSAAGWTAVTGIRGAIVPFAAGALVKANVFTPTAMLLVAAVVAVVSLLAYVPAYAAFRRPASAPPAAATPAETADVSSGLPATRA